MFSFVHIDLTLLVLTPAVSNKLYFSRFDKRNTLILTNKSNFEHFPSTRTIFWRSKIEYQIPIGQTTGTRVDRSHGSNCMRACTNTMHTPKSENSVSHFEDTGPFYNYARTIKLLDFWMNLEHRWQFRRKQCVGMVSGDLETIFSVDQENSRAPSADVASYVANAYESSSYIKHIPRPLPFFSLLMIISLDFERIHLLWPLKFDLCVKSVM